MGEESLTQGVVQETSSSHRYIVLIGIGIVLVILLAVLSVLLSRGYIKTPSPLNTVLRVTPKPSAESSIDLQTKYDNPFDKKTQYVNPFSSYKNPFNTLK